MNLWSKALFEAIQFKVVEEGRAVARHAGTVSLLRYKDRIRWRKPRSFEFDQEFQVISGDFRTALENAAKIGDLGKSHVLEVIDSPEGALMSELVGSRYELAYRVPVLGKRLSGAGTSIAPKMEVVQLGELGRGVLVLVGEVAMISDMEIEPRYRRLGYGKKLLGRLIQTAESWNARHAILVPSENALRIQFYEKMGFETRGELGVYFRG